MCNHEGTTFAFWPTERGLASVCPCCEATEATQSVLRLEEEARFSLVELTEDAWYLHTPSWPYIEHRYRPEVGEADVEWILLYGRAISSTAIRCKQYRQSGESYCAFVVGGPEGSQVSLTYPSTPPNLWATSYLFTEVTRINSGRRKEIRPKS